MFSTGSILIIVINILLGNNFLDQGYCDATSLHGVRYITEDGRHWSERMLWVILVILGFITVLIFILPILRKYLDSPTLTTIGTTNYPIWQVLTNKYNEFLEIFFWSVYVFD